MHYVYIMQSIARKRKRSRNITHAKSAAEKRAERKRLESLIHNNWRMKSRYIKFIMQPESKYKSCFSPLRKSLISAVT